MSPRIPSKRPSPAQRYNSPASNNPQPLYFLEAYGRSGLRFFIEVDRDSNSRNFVRDLILHGEHEAAKIIEVIEPCEDFPQGSVRDVTDELQSEASDLIVRAA